MGGGTSLATGLEGSLTPFNQCRQQEAFHHSAGNTLHTLPGKSGSAETTLSLLKSPETSAQCSLEQPSLAAKMAQNGLSRTGSQKRAREDDFSTPLQDSQEAKILQRHGIDVLASSRPTASSEGIAKRQKSWSNGTFEPTVSIQSKSPLCDIQQCQKTSVCSTCCVDRLLDGNDSSYCYTC